MERMSAGERGISVAGNGEGDLEYLRRLFWQLAAATIRVSS